jgi:hypothetical protein
MTVGACNALLVVCVGEEKCAGDGKRSWCGCYSSACRGYWDGWVETFVCH